MENKTEQCECTAKKQKEGMEQKETPIDGMEQKQVNKENVKGKG